MEPNKEEEIKKLEEYVKKLQDEAKIWEGKETPAAIMEKQNLYNLMYRAQEKMDELKGIKKEESKENPDELLETLKKGEKAKTEKLNSLNLHIKRMEEEQKNYSTQHNYEYREIYKEYDKKIKEAKKEISDLEKDNDKDKDKQIRTLTRGRMQKEEEIKAIQKEIRQKQNEILDIEYGTAEAQEEKEINVNGNKETIKVPKILRLNEELGKLKKKLAETTEKKDEFQKYIDKLKGIDKEKTTQKEPEGKKPPKGPEEPQPPKGSREQEPPKGPGEPQPPKGPEEQEPPKGPGEPQPPKGPGKQEPPKDKAVQINVGKQVTISLNGKAISTLDSMDIVDSINTSNKDITDIIHDIMGKLEPEIVKEATNIKNIENMDKTIVAAIYKLQDENQTPEAKKMAQGILTEYMTSTLQQKEAKNIGISYDIKSLSGVKGMFSGLSKIEKKYIKNMADKSKKIASVQEKESIFSRMFKRGKTLEALPEGRGEENTQSQEKATRDSDFVERLKKIPTVVQNPHQVEKSETVKKLEGIETISRDNGGR